MASKRPLIVAIIFGIIAVVLVYAYIKSKEEEMARRQVEYGKVVLASENIRVRTKITEGMLREEKWPLENIPETAYTEMEELYNKITSENIYAGVPLLPEQFKAETEMGDLAYQLKAEERAVTVGVTEIKAVGGNVKPGDHVDILATFKDNSEVGAPTTITVLRDVKVVAVGKDIGAQEGEAGATATPVPKTITLALSPQEAEIMTLVDENGNIRLSLRNPEERYAPLSLGTTVGDVVTYRPTHEDMVNEAKRAEEERKAAEDAYLKALGERTGYKQPTPTKPGGETKGLPPLPPIEVQPGPGETSVEVILGGKAERVTIPAEEDTGIYSLWPMVQRFDYGELFPNKTNGGK